MPYIASLFPSEAQVTYYYSNSKNYKAINDTKKAQNHCVLWSSDQVQLLPIKDLDPGPGCKCTVISGRDRIWFLDNQQVRNDVYTYTQTIEYFTPTQQIPLTRVGAAVW